ncbi:MAG: hypothetical protein ABI461_07245 [Polyangiaceae bacterium]
MIIPTTTFDTLKMVVLASFVIAVIAGWLLIPKDLDRTSARAKRIRLIILVVLAFFALTIIPAFVVEAFGTQLVIVKITTDGTTKKTRGSLFGTTPYTFQDGHTETLTNDGHTIVVDDSTTRMHVDTKSYGDVTAALATRMFGSEDEVPPMKVTTFEHPIHFVGRDNPPPHAVDGVYAEERYWLVW